MTLILFCVYNASKYMNNVFSDSYLKHLCTALQSPCILSHPLSSTSTSGVGLEPIPAIIG